MGDLLAQTAVDPPLASLADAGVNSWVRPEFVLPVLSRSVAPLSLLLQDNAIDLALASSVVSLDPGLAFDVLQLANPALGEPADAVWQLPSALVAAGRESLQSLLECAPRADGYCCGGANCRLTERMRDSVRRACIAHFLARELGRCNPKKAYLGGLLFDIPEIVPLTLAVREGFRVRLLSAMCSAMPACVVRAAIVQCDQNTDTSDPVVATIILAESCLRQPVKPVAFNLWGCWPEVEPKQRSLLLKACHELDQWTVLNLELLDPWEFMSRLERHGQ
jgi:hypothetical protein